MIAPSYISAVASILALIFPDVTIDALNVTLNTLVIVASSLVIMYRQVVNRRSTLAGMRPE
jgi:hypothetical protein